MSDKKSIGCLWLLLLPLLGAAGAIAGFSCGYFLDEGVRASHLRLEDWIRLVALGFVFGGIPGSILGILTRRTSDPTRRRFLWPVVAVCIGFSCAFLFLVTALFTIRP